MVSRSGRRNNWWLIWISTIWLLWNRRNNVVFNNGRVDLNKLFDNIILCAWRWWKARGRKFSTSFFEWQSQPLLCLWRIQHVYSRHRLVYTNFLMWDDFTWGRWRNLITFYDFGWCWLRSILVNMNPEIWYHWYPHSWSVGINCCISS